MWHIKKKVWFRKRTTSPGSSSCSTADKTDENKKSDVFEVKKRDILCSDTARYLIQDFAGEGRFGKVAKCQNLITPQDVAVKILKTENRTVAKREIKMLRVVSVLDPVKKNVVQFLEKFEYKGHTCLAFEMLDRSLLQLLRDRKMRPLSLSEIRPVAQQLLTAFDALKGIGVIHSDLKPDNIMLVNHVEKPFRVKLIDFGLSFTTSEATRGMTVQPLGYRAPEVTLGLPISEAIDMWGVGCVLAFLYLCNNPFSVHCEYEMMKHMIKVLGQPADHLLSAGINTNKFFTKNQYWRLKTPTEFQVDSGTEPKRWRKSFESLDDLIKLHPKTKKKLTELEDQRAFVSLLRGLLHPDPEQRTTPQEALKHLFVTMDHLKHVMGTSLYVAESFHKMLVCPVDDVEEELSATPGTSGAGSAAPHSHDNITDMPRSNDKAAAAGGVNASAAETSVTKRPPVKVKQLKRIQRLFGKAT